MTNYEKILSLKINKMAEFLTKDVADCMQFSCENFEYYPIECNQCKDYKSMLKESKRWLRDEYKKGNISDLGEV